MDREAKPNRARQVWTVGRNLLAAALFSIPFQICAVRAEPHDPASAALCDAAAQRAAARSGVPVSVLRAISLTETGRTTGGRFAPWPWTVNMEGKGKWFASSAEALRYVEAQHARGARSYDLGCFQLNARWHGAAFPNLPTMLDPDRNAEYAARFLSDLYREFGDWSLAAGAYHSRTHSLANAYRARFDRIRSRLTGKPAATVATVVQQSSEIPPTPQKVYLGPTTLFGDPTGSNTPGGDGRRASGSLFLVERSATRRLIPLAPG